MFESFVIFTAQPFLWIVYISITQHFKSNPIKYSCFMSVFYFEMLFALIKVILRIFLVNQKINSISATFLTLYN